MTTRKFHIPRSEEVKKGVQGGHTLDHMHTPRTKRGEKREDDGNIYSTQHTKAAMTE